MARQQINVVWFKRDLRLHDHHPLHQAIEAGQPLLLLYIYEPSLMEQPYHDLRHWQFVWQSLKDMQQVDKLNYAISVCHQEATDVFRQLFRFFDVQTVYSYEEMGTQHSFDRDLAIKKLFRAKKVAWKESPYAGVRRGLKNREGWSKYWHEVMNAEQDKVGMDKLKKLCLRLSVDNLSAHQAIKGKPLPRELMSHPEGMQGGGELLAQERLQSFLSHRAEGYSKNGSHPILSRHSGSRLSAHLAWGNLSVRQVFQYYKQHIGEAEPLMQADLRAFGSRLRWHCHYIQKFESECRIEFENLNSVFDQLDQQFDPQLFEAWKNGQTGYPLVDAAMRCLHKTGFLNFQMRAMLISFWCHQLWQPWQPAAAHLASQFLDFEPGIHFPQVQIQAGVTGIDPIRIYNPVKQAKDLDPQAKFVLQWLPELKKLPLHFIIEPWTLRPLEQLFHDVQLGVHYPAPIVDIKKSNARARQVLWALKDSPEAQANNQLILAKHAEGKKTEKET